MPVCAICERETEQLHHCSEYGRMVCDSCYVEAVDMCMDCEETWEAEEDLDFPEAAHAHNGTSKIRSFAVSFYCLIACSCFGWVVVYDCCWSTRITWLDCNCSVTSLSCSLKEKIAK